MCLTRDDAFGASTASTDPVGHLNGVPCDQSAGSIPSGAPSICDNAPTLGPAGTFSGAVTALGKYLAFHTGCHAGTDQSGLLTQAECVTLHSPADATIHAYGYGWTCYQRAWAKGPDARGPKDPTTWRASIRDQTL